MLPTLPGCSSLDWLSDCETLYLQLSWNVTSIPLADPNRLEISHLKGQTLELMKFTFAEIDEVALTFPC